MPIAEYSAQPWLMYNTIQHIILSVNYCLRAVSVSSESLRLLPDLTIYQPLHLAKLCSYFLRRRICRTSSMYHHSRAYATPRLLEPSQGQSHTSTARPSLVHVLRQPFCHQCLWLRGPFCDIGRVGRDSAGNNALFDVFNIRQRQMLGRSNIAQKKAPFIAAMAPPMAAVIWS